MPPEYEASMFHATFCSQPRPPIVETESLFVCFLCCSHPAYKKHAMVRCRHMLTVKPRDLSGIAQRRPTKVVVANTIESLLVIATSTSYDCNK